MDRALGVALLLSGLVACGSDRPTRVAEAQEGCQPDGSLSVAMYGGLRGEINWRGADLQCASMPRPRGAGARLRFSGELEVDAATLPLAFIIGLPDLEPGAPAKETRANVTLMQEDSGRFFSSADAPVCWSDVTQPSLLDADKYLIKGSVFCVAPLAELNGAGGVSIEDLEFSGVVDWGAEH